MLFKTDTVQDLPQKLLFRCLKDATIQEVLQGMRKSNAGAALLEGTTKEQPLVITEHMMIRALASQINLSDLALPLASHVPCVMSSLQLEKLPESILQYEGVLIFEENNPVGFVTQDSLSAILTNLQKPNTTLGTDDELSADLAHSLQIIKTCCDYIFSEEQEKMTKNSVDFVKRIQENASLATEMLRQLSKTDIWSHQGLNHTYSLHIGQTIQSWAVDLRMITFERQQTLELDISRDIEVTVDSGRLRSILQNIIEYTSQIAPVSESIQLKTSWYQGEATIHVTAKLSADETPSLGQNYPLRIARHLLEELGGSLSVEEKDHQLTLIIRLPEATLIENEELLPRKLKILIVDDEPDILTFVQECLAPYEAEILTASNGAEGLKLFVEHHPEVILSDIKMPEMDGLQLLNRIKTQSRHSIVILSSGFYLNINEDLSHNMFHADRILPKPYTVGELKACLNRCLILHNHPPLFTQEP